MTKNKGLKSREKIISEAIRVFAKEGYAAATLQTIAKRAGLRHTAILHHFGDKGHLFHACLEEILRHFGELIEDCSDPKDNACQRLDRLFEINLRLVLEFPEEVTLIISMYPIATHERHIRTLYGETLVSSRRRYETLVRSAIRERLFADISDPILVAELLHEFIIGAMVNLLAASKDIARDIPKIRKKWSLLRGSFELKTKSRVAS